MQFQTLKLRITNSLTDMLKLKLAPVKISKILLVSYAKITYKKFINRHAEIAPVKISKILQFSYVKIRIKKTKKKVYRFSTCSVHLAFTPRMKIFFQFHTSFQNSHLGMKI